MWITNERTIERTEKAENDAKRVKPMTLSVMLFAPGMEYPREVEVSENGFKALLRKHNPHMRTMEYTTVSVNGIEVDVWYDSEFRNHAEYMSAMYGDMLFIRGGFLVAGHEGEQTISVPSEVVNKLTESMDYVQIEDDDTHGWVVRF